VVGQVAATGKPILLDDVRSFPDYVATLPGVRSELCVPVSHKGSDLAVLNIESTRHPPAARQRSRIVLRSKPAPAPGRGHAPRR